MDFRHRCVSLRHIPPSPCPTPSHLLPGLVTHTKTHVFGCATAIVPVVGDALHPVFGYFLVVRPASKAKYVFPVIHVPPFLPIALFFITFHSCVSLPFSFSCHALVLSPFDHLCRLPKALTRRMILNLAISAAIGIVPILGDVLIASYRANVRNARLLENFLLLRSERVAKGGSRTAPAISEKGPKNNKGPGVDGDEGDSEEARGTDKARALPDTASLSQPGAGGASSSECEKTALVLDEADGDHEKDKSADVAPVPEGASEGEGARVQLRPPRNPLEFVQQRDSRFIEDVT